MSDYISLDDLKESLAAFKSEGTPHVFASLPQTTILALIEVTQAALELCEPKEQVDALPLWNHLRDALEPFQEIDTHLDDGRYDLGCDDRSVPGRSMKLKRKRPMPRLTRFLFAGALLCFTIPLVHIVSKNPFLGITTALGANAALFLAIHLLTSTATPADAGSQD